MIESISVRNLGPFGSTATLPLKPETVIIGPNSIGKSTFITAYSALAVGQLFGAPMSPYQNFRQATYLHKNNDAVVLTAKGKVSGVEVEKTISFNPNGTVQASWLVDHRNRTDLPQVQEFQNELQNSVYLSSQRGFFQHEENIGGVSALNYNGAGINKFLLERWTSRDKNWNEAEKWLTKIDPNFVLLKSPLRGNVASIETTRKYGNEEADINLSTQGSGIQRALQIISYVVFAQPSATIIIEEPEMNMHKETAEVMVDLFNTAVNKLGKKIIITTHSWDILLPFVKDVSQEGSKRSSAHEATDSTKFSLMTFKRDNGRIDISDYDLQHKIWRQISSDFHLILG